MTKTEMKRKKMMLGVSGISVCKRYRETANKAKYLFVNGCPWVGGEEGGVRGNIRRELVNGYGVWQKV